MHWPTGFGCTGSSPASTTESEAGVSVRGRRLVIFLPVVVTLLLTGVIGSVILVQNQRNADLVVEADDVGSAFLGDVVVFRSTVEKAVTSSGTADPGELRTIVERAIADAPTLADTSAYGIERSVPYAQAQSAEKTFLEPYRRLVRELRRADIALEFISRARDVLRLRTSDYLGFGLIDSSGPVRTKLIPAFAEARDDFATVRVPKGQEALAATVTGAAQYVIDQATALANSIEANRSFTFSYADQFQAAIDAVDDYATVVKGDLAEAVNAVTDEP